MLSKRSIYCFLLLIVLSLVQYTVSAQQNITVKKISQGNYEITAKTEKTEEFLTLTVLYPNFSLEDVNEKNAINAIYTVKQFENTDGFTYRLTIDDSNAFGFYTAYLGYASNDAVNEGNNIEFFHASTSYVNNVIAEFNNATESTCVALYVKYANEFPILNINTVENNKYESIIKENFLKYKGSFKTLNNIEESYYNAVCTSSANQINTVNDAESFFMNYSSNFNVDLLGDYANYKNDILKLFLLSIKDHKPYHNLQTLKKDVRCSVALGTINHSTREGVISKTEEYAQDLEVDINGYYREVDKMEFSKALHNKDFTSQTQFSNAFQAKLEQMQSDAKKSNSGNGKGTSSGGGSRSNNETFFDNTVPNASNQNIEPQAFQVAAPFPDIKDVPWAENAIDELRKRGIVNGNQDNYFLPSEYVTREQFIKMLLLTVNADMSGLIDCEFIDVNKKEWYYPYICKGVESGIVKGQQDGSFGISKFITREEMVTFIHRATIANDLYSKQESNNIIIKDIAETAPYATESVQFLYKSDVIKGKYEGVFAPKDLATRAETAQILYNVIQKFERR